MDSMQNISKIIVPEILKLICCIAQQHANSTVIPARMRIIPLRKSMFDDSSFLDENSFSQFRVACYINFYNCEYTKDK